MDRTIILYHGHCPDGFGGAYAAWKKFGDSAEYIALSRKEPSVEGLEGANLYFIDFTYNAKEQMDEFVKVAKSVNVLDHHEGVSEITKSMENHVYDANRSGASIAWEYFHPGVPMPELIRIIEDDDLFRYALPETRPLLSYLGVRPFTFEFWDETANALENPEKRAKLLDKANTYGEYFVLLAELAVRSAKTVEFEGYTCKFATAHPYKPMKSLVGNLLAKDTPPIALVVAAHPEGYGVSIRGDGSVDVSKIAQKFGGNGHPNSAGFLIPREGPFPWTIVEPAYDE